MKRLIDWLNSQGLAHFETEQALVGGAAYEASKQAITDATMFSAMAADAVIFGAVGGPKWDSVPYEARPEAGLLRLRKGLALFANLRPAVCYPALAEASSLKREVVAEFERLAVVGRRFGIVLPRHRNPSKLIREAANARKHLGGVLAG